jgi:poly(3-hydroxybutyrate) depolymerase
VRRSIAPCIWSYADAGGASRGWQTSAAADGNADVTFFDAMVTWLETHGCIDRTRIFVLGYSNGAQFANRLACDRPDVIAGIAVAAGRLPCAPAAAAPVIVSHGLGDRTAPYRLAVEASRVWATRNACSAPPATGAVGCSAASGCQAAETVFCTYAGGHEYDPSFTARAMEFFTNVR